MKYFIKLLFKFKMLAAFNILGLATAFAAFILISTQIRYELSYNGSFEDYKSIYNIGLVNTEFNETDFFLNREFPLMCAEIPEVRQVAVFTGIGSVDNTLITGEKEFRVPERIFSCDYAFLDMFSFEFTEGEKETFRLPGHIIVSEEFARKWLGELPALGATIVDENKKSYTISGVYKSIPKNSSIEGNLFINLGDTGINESYLYNYLAFIKTHKGVAKTTLEKSLQKVYNDRYKTNDTKPVAVNLSEARYRVDGYSQYTPYVMMVIAFVIILLAFINFLNFGISTVPVSLKDITLRKVVGASRTTLIRNILASYLLLVILSFGVSILLVESAKATAVNSIFYDTGFESNKYVYLVTLLVFIATGILSGLYPALYSTSFKPAFVLKGNPSLSPKGVKIRKILVGLQFFISLSFICISLIIFLQYKYMLNQDTGYQKANILRVAHQGSYYRFREYNALKEELLKDPRIIDVTFSGDEFAGGSYDYMNSLDIDTNKTNLKIISLEVDYNFPEFFGIRLLDGKTFKKGNSSGTRAGYYLVNQAFASKYNYSTGCNLPSLSGKRSPVIGTFGNICLTNVKEIAQPASLIYFTRPLNPYSNTYIKFSGDYADVMENIQQAYKKIAPALLYDIRFLEEDLKQAYKTENTSRIIMQSFAFISVVIAMMGIAVLVSFDTKYKKKEIGIRKISGARTVDILILFSRQYITLLTISFILSVPAVYFIMHNWLEQFPNRIGIHYWIFTAAFLLVLLLSSALIFIQSIYAARANPANSISR